MHEWYASYNGEQMGPLDQPAASWNVNSRRAGASMSTPGASWL